MNDEFPLKDLENNITYELTVKEYDFLPSTIEIISSFWLDPRAQSSTYLGHVTGPGAKIDLAHLKNWKQNPEKIGKGKSG